MHYGQRIKIRFRPSGDMDFFKARPLDVSDLSVTEADLAAYEPERIKPVTLLFQTGYLTIKTIEQMQAKEYTDRFRSSGKPITLVGIAFSTKRRTVSGVKIVKDA